MTDFSVPVPTSLRGHVLPVFLRPPRTATVLTDPEAIRTQYRHYRPRILLWSTIGYGTFYFVRKNLSVAIPLLLANLHLTTESVGLILTFHGLMYGVCKFLGGMLADRANARVMMSVALLMSAGLNVCFGFSAPLLFFGLFWTMNGVFQGMGYPPCARLLTHWFAPKELATKMSIWNMSHSLGGGAILILCGLLVNRYHDWRLCFFVPAGIAAAVSILLMIFLRDTPRSVGLPEIDGTHVPGGDTANESTEDFLQCLRDCVFSNRYIWLVSIANFFVYTIRFSVFDWGPTLLKQYKGIALLHAAGMVAAFEVAGTVGMLVTGFLTDRWFGGRGAPLSLISMLLCGGSIFGFWMAPGGHPALNTVLLMSTGFFVYGPQALVGVMSANLATKRAAATAVGLTSIFGYASTILSGYGMGWLVKHYGWPPAFLSLIGIAVMGAGLFALVLPAKANGYTDEPT